MSDEAITAFLDPNPQFGPVRLKVPGWVSCPMSPKEAERIGMELICAAGQARFLETIINDPNQCTDACSESHTFAPGCQCHAPSRPVRQHDPGCYIEQCWCREAKS